MRVFLSSTPDELALHRAAAQRVVCDLGWEAVGADDCELVLAIVGWSRGPVPRPELGGDGVRPWAQWEVGRAFQRSRPVVVLMASEAWTERESTPEARAAMADFRAELSPLAVPFDPEPEGTAPARFERLLRAELESRSRTPAKRTAATSEPSSASDLGLRVWPLPELPERPWPVLLPYSHPALLAGRERELRELTERLDRPLPILGLHAVSGTGTSSLLQGGLVPRFRAAGRAVVLERHPAEPGLASRLIGDLLDGSRDALEVGDDDHQTFVARLLTARRCAGDRPPILVLDQFEDVLRAGSGIRAVIGTLLAATTQRRPGLQGPLCRWLLAYRRELHGPLLRWLADALREARALGLAGVEDLPHDLASHDRFHSWPLPPLDAAAAKPPLTESLRDSNAASATFLSAITAPLALVNERGRPRYPWRFAGDGAERLARAFGEARVRQPSAPLVPELQVVLAHLVEAAGEPIRAAALGPEARGRGRFSNDVEPAVLVVPDDPSGLIDDALEEHLGRSLDAAFKAPDRIGRTRALLALRELADAEGRRGSRGCRGGGRSGDDLTRAIGHEGHEVLERLQAPQRRIVVTEWRGDDLLHTLSHDRLAEVIVRAVEGGAAAGRLAVDPEVLSLHRFVALQTSLFQSGDRERATQVSGTHASGVEAHADTLLLDDERRRWWQACMDRRRSDRWRRAALLSVAAAVALLVGWVTCTHVARKAGGRREADAGQIIDLRERARINGRTGRNPMVGLLARTAQQARELGHAHDAGSRKLPPRIIRYGPPVAASGPLGSSSAASG